MFDANVYRFVQDTKDRMMLQLEYLRSDTKRKKHYENGNEIIVYFIEFYLYEGITTPTRKQYYVFLRSDRRGGTFLRNLHIICKYVTHYKFNRGNVSLIIPEEASCITEFNISTTTQAWRIAKNASTHPDSVAAWLLLLPVVLLMELLLAELEFASSICAVFSSELHCLITSSPCASSSEIIVASSSSCNAGLEFNLKEKERPTMIMWFDEKWQYVHFYIRVLICNVYISLIKNYIA